MSDRRAERWEGVTAEALALRWGSPMVSLYSSVGSTNDVARALGAGGAAAGVVVLAEEQVAGRGRVGRQWSSPPGLGLWFSVVGEPAAAADAATLPLRVGLAVADALDFFLPPPGAGIKWPNDVWVGERKLGGILCEAAWEGGRPGRVVAGVGLNLLHRASDFPAEISAGATSLSLEARGPVSRAEVADRVIPAVVQAVRGGVFDVLAMRRRDLLEGRAVVVADPMTGQELARGVAAGIAPDGALRVRGEEGAELQLRSGTVRLAGGGEGR